MNIKRIDNFRFLGLNFTHKSKLFPKSIVNYYKETYSTNLTISEKIQKFINRLFPNYLVETNKQKRWRTDYSCFELDIFANFYDSLKNNKLKDINLSQDEIKKIGSLWWDDKVTYLRKLYDEGRLGKPLE